MTRLWIGGNLYHPLYLPLYLPSCIVPGISHISLDIETSGELGRIPK